MIWNRFLKFLYSFFFCNNFSEKLQILFVLQRDIKKSVFCLFVDKIMPNHNFSDYFGNLKLIKIVNWLFSWQQERVFNILRDSTRELIALFKIITCTTLLNWMKTLVNETHQFVGYIFLLPLLFLEAEEIFILFKLTASNKTIQYRSNTVDVVALSSELVNIWVNKHSVYSLYHFARLLVR